MFYLPFTLPCRKVAGAVPIFKRNWIPHLTQCRLGRGLPPYLVASWSIQPFSHNRHRPKIGGAVPLWWELGPHLTQCRLAKVYLRTKCQLDPSSRLATTDMGRKLGAAVPYLLGELGPHLTQCGRGRGLPPCQV